MPPLMRQDWAGEGPHQAQRRAAVERQRQVGNRLGAEAFEYD